MRTSKIAHPGPSLAKPFYSLARIWLALTGWKVVGGVTAPQVVLIAHPHTTNWDLPHMLAASGLMRLRISWMGKDSLFKPPFGAFMRFLGGIAVDRSGPRGQVGAAADLFAKHDKLVLAVPPSGTRSKRDKWKSGFYWIALSADVPIACGYLDYARKESGIGLMFVPTGDVVADMDRIRAFYKDIRGKFPDQETTIRLDAESDPEGTAARVAAIRAEQSAG